MPQSAMLVMLCLLNIGQSPQWTPYITPDTRVWTGCPSPSMKNRGTLRIINHYVKVNSWRHIRQKRLAGGALYEFLVECWWILDTKSKWTNSEGQFTWMLFYPNILIYPIIYPKHLPNIPRLNETIENSLRGNDELVFKTLNNMSHSLIRMRRY